MSPARPAPEYDRHCYDSAGPDGPRDEVNAIRQCVKWAVTLTDGVPIEPERNDYRDNSGERPP